MSKARVFVVQVPSRYDRNSRSWVEKYDLSAAEDYGELTHLLPPGNIFRDELVSATKQIKRNLGTMTDRDYILAVGDPVAISIAVMVASLHFGGRVQLLKYDKRGGCYDCFAVDILEGEDLQF